MNDDETKRLKVARTLLPYLESLYLARLQANKQLKRYSGQHRDYWLMVINDIVEQIENTERDITRLSPVGKFKRINNGK